jgi:Uma2 family endonuclease
VVSPHDLTEESLRKIHEYFQAGVTLVWVVYPEERHVYIYGSPTQIRVLTTDDTVDGGTVLPGFQLALDRLVDPVVPASEGA